MSKNAINKPMSQLVEEKSNYLNTLWRKRVREMAAEVRNFLERNPQRIFQVDEHKYSRAFIKGKPRDNLECHRKYLPISKQFSVALSGSA